MQTAGLDEGDRDRERRIMNRTTLLVAMIAAAALAGCNKQNNANVAGGPDDPAAEASVNAPVVLPPSIQSSKTYRCKDNSVVYVNFMTDNVSANVRDVEEEPPTVTLKAAAPGEPFVGEGEVGKGFKLEGNGATVTYTSPDSGTQSCKA